MVWNLVPGDHGLWFERVELVERVDPLQSRQPLVDALYDRSRCHRPYVRKLLLERVDAKEVVAMTVGDVDVGQVLAGRRDLLEELRGMNGCEERVHQHRVSLAV